MAQIEPIEIFGCENKGVCLNVYFCFFENDKLRGEVLDSFNNVLFTKVVSAKTIKDVAQQLGLKLKTE